ncbi:hypothetical protein [Deinococcus arenicola]|uniref:Uncharacterized protein n=1 Tax=Deinococcus arenicola TaxID=2994950 RepID=A0ABU4DWQ2_9DEIO|nr:hypothetical protein [Deinococcus sp. ZS9-10]MDV6376310.1 hypothetical protein [Deinococcus sp. ZS9-10]
MKLSRSPILGLALLGSFPLPLAGSALSAKRAAMPTADQKMELMAPLLKAAGDDDLEQLQSLLKVDASPVPLPETLRKLNGQGACWRVYFTWRCKIPGS